MSKDIDSVRVALERAITGLSLKDQAQLVAEWLEFAFPWDETPQGRKFWSEVRDGLRTLAPAARWRS